MILTKKLVLRLFLGVVVLPSAVAGVFYHLNETGFFNIQKIQLNLSEVPESHSEFLKPLKARLEKDVRPLKGQSLWSISMGKVSRLIQGNAWIEGYQVHRAWPNELVITVQPSEVKMLLLSKGGEVIPVLKDGQMLAPVAVKQAPDVIVGAGENFKKEETLRRRAIETLRELPESGSFTAKNISEISYDQKEGFWMTLIRSGTVVKIGEDHVALKAARVSKVVDYLESKQFDARVIDANLSKKVLVRLRKDP